jgi:hypothetical protein
MKYFPQLYSIGLVTALSTFQTDFSERDFSIDLSPKISADCAKEKGTAKVVCLAEAFKATLNAEQAAQLQLEYNKSNAVKWSNFPEFRPTRVGIRLGLLNPAQLAVAKALMSAVLSHESEHEGFGEMEGNLAADDFFGQHTNNPKLFSSGNFFIAFLGKPSTTDLWELQFGGHHFAFANTYKGGKIIGATPSFRGVEPSVFEWNGKKYQPLEQEKEAFAALIGLLKEEEKTTAKLRLSFNNILLGPNQDGKFPLEKQGVKVGNLSSAQQKWVKKAMESYVRDLDAETADEFMKKYTAELPDTYVAYAGSGTMNQVGDYVRIDGPSIWIEYSAQPSRDIPGTTHPHSVWRDRKSDYGGN